MPALIVLSLCIYCTILQKRDNGSGTFTSTSDKSSGAKSISTPSTPKAESVNLHLESRLSHSMPTECTPADLLLEARQDREIPEDEFLRQETPLVWNLVLMFESILYWNKLIRRIVGLKFLFGPFDCRNFKKSRGT